MRIKVGEHFWFGHHPYLPNEWCFGWLRVATRMGGARWTSL
jgi:hypothetical protein